MSSLFQLLPQPLWSIFANICAIPHPSYHEELLAQYIVNLTNKQGLLTERDIFGNILIRKSATLGYEHKNPVIIQAHLDMVPQKNINVIHNFFKDPIQPYIDGEWIKAHGTTLGADNGIGIASALAILLDKNIQHGPLEVLFTMTEESGMEGAFKLQPNWLKGNLLINTDSEEEGIVYIGCAGGVDYNIILPLSWDNIPTNLQIVNITLTGLKGGHSGSDIHLGLGNAIKLLIRFLSDYCYMLDFRLLNFYGGTLYNVIPREAFALIAISQKNIILLRNQANLYLNIIKKELDAVEKTIILEVNYSYNQDKEKVLTKNCSNILIALLKKIPNGIINTSNNIQNLVDTSLNIGIVSMQTEQVNIGCLIRFIKERNKLQIENLLHSIVKSAGATNYSNYTYPSWQPNFNSSLMHLFLNIYYKLFNNLPNVKIIHAGLECGLLKKIYPKMDIISIGPTIISPHSPEERVHIASVEKYWKLLTILLQKIPNF